MKAITAVILLAMLGGCVYQPIHVELYNSTNVGKATVAVDASRNVNEKEPVF
ncbi:MAG: hypothetical protein [Bacteriophage sp.]|nr:MAG: hypothetical protein [Bacteriophage sp.]